MSKTSSPVTSYVKHFTLVGTLHFQTQGLNLPPGCSLVPLYILFTVNLSSLSCFHFIECGSGRVPLNSPNSRKICHSLHFPVFRVSPEGKVSSLRRPEISNCCTWNRKRKDLDKNSLMPPDQSKPLSKSES